MLSHSLILAGRKAPGVIIGHRIAGQVFHPEAHPGSIYRIFLKIAGRREDGGHAAIAHRTGKSSASPAECKCYSCRVHRFTEGHTGGCIHGYAGGP